MNRLASMPGRPGVISSLLTAAIAVFLSACATPLPEAAGDRAVSVRLAVDGDQRELSTTATNVRELLELEAIALAEADLVEPPLFTPLSEGLEIRIIRVSDSIEVIEQAIPFQRRVVRNESMSADEHPQIIQAGRAGLREVTVRIVYHDGLEYSRQETEAHVFEEARDEIVMIGVGAAAGSVEFEGVLAYISGGDSVMMRGSSAFPEQLNTGGELDQRVFALSPSGSHLLYTRVATGDHFNSLWVVEARRAAPPRPLEVHDVLWAGWNPDRLGLPEIAYTTGLKIDLLPGWEANNDLWVGDIPLGERQTFEPRQLIEAYPATYGWWGGNYAWSPTGRTIAFSFADEVGLIDVQAQDAAERVLLDSFTEYITRSEWVWVPSLSWSPDGNYLAYNRHAGDDPDAAEFETWVVEVASGLRARFAEQSGIWSHPRWSPPLAAPFARNDEISQIAFLRSTNPLDSLRSSYTLWLMDRDGSNAHQLFPAVGENSRFGQDDDFLAWGPTGTQMAFVYNDAIYLYDLARREAARLTLDDGDATHPTWAPYGRAWSLGAAAAQPTRTPSPEDGE